MKDKSKRQGISEVEASNVSDKILEVLSPELRRCIARTSAPYFRNFQISCDIKGLDENEMYNLARQIGDLCRDRNIRVRGALVFAAVEQPDWKRTRNRIMRTAEFALVKLIPGLEGNLKLDWAAGMIYSLPQGVPEGELLGVYVRSSESWTWEKKVIGAAPYNLSVEMLEESRATALDEQS